MTKLSQRAVDPRLANEGRWCHYDGSIHLRIARMNNPAYNRALAGERKQDLTTRRGQIDTDKVALRQRIAAGRGLVTDWWGIDAENVEPQRFEGDEVGPDQKAGAAPRLISEIIVTDGLRVAVYEKDGKHYRKCSSEHGDPKEHEGLYMEVVPFSEEASVEIMKDPLNLDLFEFVQMEASSANEYLVEQGRSDLGN